MRQHTKVGLRVIRMVGRAVPMSEGTLVISERGPVVNPPPLTFFERGGWLTSPPLVNPPPSNILRGGGRFEPPPPLVFF